VKPLEAEAYFKIAGVNFCLKITAEQELWTQLISLLLIAHVQQYFGLNCMVAPIPSHLGLHGAKPQLQNHFYDFKALCSGGNSILEILKPEDKV
jgi:hypothetical protein